VSSDNDIRMELIVVQSFLTEATERGLLNAAMILTEQVSARKQALAKLSYEVGEHRGNKCAKNVRRIVGSEGACIAPTVGKQVNAKD
jgi:hypothetical protein